MANVLEPGTASGAVMPPRAQAHDLAEAGECASHHTPRQTRSTLRDEERQRLAAWPNRVSQRRVGRQRRAGGALQRYEAGLAKLRFSNGQDAAHEVHVTDVELERFAGSQAGGGEKPDERLERGATQSRRRTQLTGGGHQGGDLAVAVDVGRRTALPRGDNPLRRSLRPRIRGLEPDSECPHDAEPACVRGTLDACGLERPTHGKFRSDKLCAFGFEKIDELAQGRLRPHELCAQRPSRREVLRKGVVEDTHRTTPALGHGRATPRSPSNATLV